MYDTAIMESVRLMLNVKQTLLSIFINSIIFNKGLSETMKFRRSKALRKEAEVGSMEFFLV
jgi:hypothetical protein